MRSKLIYAVLLPLVLVAFRFAGSRAVSESSPHTPEATQEILQPVRWVAFEADYKETEQGTQVSTGRYFRSTDGSTRLETGDGTHNTVISIKNIARATMYVYCANPDAPDPDAGWIWMSFPMELPSTGWHPLPRRVNQHLKPHPERIGGLTVYKMSSPGGEISLQAPELNFFTLVTELENGQRREFHNIRRVEPPAELFLPPPGVEVRAKSKPLGIRMRGKDSQQGDTPVKPDPK
jgi:hypothetical protein